MQLVRYVSSAGIGVGVRPDADSDPRPLPVPSLAALWQLGTEEVRAAVTAASEAEPIAGARLLPPIDELTEVWAAGVTYYRSSEARQEESQAADVYERVYRSARPELFFKSPAWRVCGDGEPVGIRVDSELDVPEPELAIVCNAAGRVVGVTACSDMSSRSIEGENPLYLPQAKIYSGSCALGPGIAPIWEIEDVRALGISVEVRRAGSPVWAAKTSTELLRRSPEDLVEHLFRQATFPHGVVLSTGTGLVPELDFSLQPGDEVVIDIDAVGRLTNQVRLASEFEWLTPRPDRMPA